MKDHTKALMFASFAADSLALGAHWIYDTKEIEKTFGRIEFFQSPDKNPYHGTKQKGDFTHYGDQTMVLLNSIKESKGFDLSHFSQKWCTFIENYSGYIDQASKTTLENINGGKSPDTAGSQSEDLGGASRIAPLSYIYAKDLNALVLSARTQTAMTHNNPLVKGAADFFARVTYHTLQGEKPSDAIQKVVSTNVRLDEIKEWVKKGEKSISKKTSMVIKKFGQMCSVSAALPGVIHLILKYENDLSSALIENVMAGGDSSARGMIVGMILGAYLGLDAIPTEWMNGLNALSSIESFFL